MKLKYLYTIICLCASLRAASQPGKKEDVIYLKNESVVRGIIIENTGTKIKLQMSDGSIFVYASDEIAKLSKEPKFGAYQYDRKGYANFTELGPLVAGKTTIDGVTTAAFSFQTVNGYKYSRYFYTGLGIGVDLYATQTIIPVFASVRGDVSKGGAVIPFYFADAGYGFNITQDSPGNTDFKGGLLYAAGLGVKIPFNRTAGFMISFGYRYQSSNYRLNGTKKEVEYNRLAIRAGFFL